MKRYEPEGRSLAWSRTQFTLTGLRRALERSTVLEAMVTHCDETHTLYLSLGEVQGLIPREETAVGVSEGTTREVAILSRVGRPVCFRVMQLQDTPEGWVAICSRRHAQQEALEEYQTNLRPGDILPATVAGLARFGAFCDLGRGVLGLLPSCSIAVSHTLDASERFGLGQSIYVAVRSVADGRITLSHRELLGTWRDNAARFEAGQTVPGIVCGVMPYGVFIELTPNLSGLCEPRDDLKPGERVSVWIKSIQPETQKVKLAVVSKLPPAIQPPDYQYIRRQGHIDFWQYAPAINGKEPILTCF